ncbi:MAG: YihY family inner membrane protein [Pirellulales bacterium]|nr:YihY family inner membrane protein [Pirellulales bacterium]
MPRFFEYIVDAVRRPREQLSRGQHFVRFSWDLAIHCWRQLQRHRAEGMAAELTYRTIFSLIPVVVLGLVMFRVVGGLDDVQNKVENQLYSFFGVPEIPEEYDSAMAAAVDDQPDSSPQAVTLETDSDKQPDPLVPPGAADDLVDPPQPPLQEAAPPSEPNEEQRRAASEAEARREARASIRRTLREVTHKVASIDFASIGVFGLLLFLYAAVALADSTEHLFNRIFEAPAQRPVHIRIAIHWSIITLGSGLLAMSLYLSGQVVEWFGTIGVGRDIRWVLSHALAVTASWVLLFLLYALMPNTHVSVKAAAIGALVGALLWEAAKFGFQVYVATAVPYSAIYGSIGLIPLFLFWVYVTWLIVLFGLILTYTLQTLRGSRDVPSGTHDDDVLMGDPDWMLPIMSEVAQAFSAGQSIDNQELADRLGLSGLVTHGMVGKLVEASLLCRVSAGAGQEDSLTLAKPAEKILVADILSLAHQSRPTSDHPAWETLGALKDAERKAAQGKTLRDLLLPAT